MASVARTEMFVASFGFLLLSLLGVASSIQPLVSIGKFTEFAHDVRSGPVYVLNDKKIRITNLAYDGEGPDVFFWAGKSARGTPDSNGQIVPYLNSSTTPIPGFNGSTTIDLTLPNELTVKDINYLSIWCRAYTVDFGHVVIPEKLDIPASDAAMAVSDKKVNSVATKKPKPIAKVVNRQFGNGTPQKIRRFGEEA